MAFNHRTKVLCGRRRERGQHLSTGGDVQKLPAPHPASLHPPRPWRTGQKVFRWVTPGGKVLSESSHHLVRSELREVKTRMETRRQECGVAEKTQEQWQRTKDKSSSRRATNVLGVPCTGLFDQNLYNKPTRYKLPLSPSTDMEMKTWSN